MQKRGFIGLLVLLIVLFVLGFFWFMKNYEPTSEESIIQEEIAIECTADSDCVPASCCHPKTCVALKDAPKCDGIFCSMSCEPDTLDCGQGSCMCIEGKCSGVLK